MIYNNYPDDYIVINAKWVEWDNDEQRWCFMTEDAFEKAQSLTNYTKQVCEKIREKLSLHCDYKENIGWYMPENKFNLILDQIENEKESN